MTDFPVYDRDVHKLFVLESKLAGQMAESQI